MFYILSGGIEITLGENSTISKQQNFSDILSKSTPIFRCFYKPSDLWLFQNIHNHGNVENAFHVSYGFD